MPVSSTTVASMNSVDLSLTMTWQSSMSGEMAFSSSSSLEPLAVLVAGSSGMILLACRLLSRAVSASRRVWAIFSMTLPPVSSERWGLRAALCFRARLLRAFCRSSRKDHGARERRGQTSSQRKSQRNHRGKKVVRT